MAATPSTRQQRILDFLYSYLADHSYPPTVREIGAAVGLRSSSTVQSHLDALERKGYIARDGSKSRTVMIVGAHHKGPSTAPHAYSLPLVGRVAAGVPILAEENVEDRIALGPEIAGSEDSFCLRVHGDSMIEVGINDGDLVVVRPQKTAENGTIVVARMSNPITGDSEVTVKRIYRESGRIRLQPENSSMEPIFATDVELEGKVVAVIRLVR